MNARGNPPDAGLHHASEHFEEGEEAPPPGVHAMAIVRWALILLMAATAATSVVYYFGWVHHTNGSESDVQYTCPMHPSVVQDHPGECPICSMTLVPRQARKKAGTSGSQAMPAPAPAGTTTSTAADGGTDQAGAYYCPMHPNETSHDPNARCPECGMKMELRPKPTGPQGQAPAPPSHGESAGEMSGPQAMPRMKTDGGGSRSAGSPTAPGREGTVPQLATVELTPDRIQLLGMRTAPVRREPLQSNIRTVGYVAANEKGLAQIHTRFAGWIEHLSVNQTGQRVERGQVLATIYSPELLNAQQEFLNALRWASRKGDADSVAGEAIGGLADDSRRRLELLGISKPDIDQLARTGKPMRALTVRSPVSGYVTAKNVLSGASVDSSAVLFEVTDLSTVWVVADVFEFDIDRVRTGQRVKLDLSGLPGISFTGAVEFVYPTVDPATRTLRVRMQFPNPGLRLRPGMYGNVTLQLKPKNGLVAPSEAVVDTGELQYVFLAREGGRFEPRRVRVGQRSGDETQLLEGVDEGDIVVTTANFLLDSESRLRATIEGATETAGGDAMTSVTDSVIDEQRFPDKYQQYRACEVQHRGMGTMEEDCKNAIPKPWK